MNSGGNIILCGFMGSGKSTVGLLLANLSGREFVDLDTFITQREGFGIPELFGRFGEDGFRNSEHQAILALQGRRAMVLATGGGAAAFARNLPPLRRLGPLVFLNPGFEECYRRIKHGDRPLVRQNTPERLRELHDAREGIYRAAADIEIRALGAPEEQAAEILARLWPAAGAERPRG